MADISVPAGPGRHVKTFNIADNTTTSDAIRIPAGTRLVAVQFPASVDATSVTFTGSYNGATYVQITDPAGVAVTVVIASSKYVLMPDLFGVPFLKFVLGTQQTTGSAGIDLGLVFEAAPASYWHSEAILAAS